MFALNKHKVKWLFCIGIAASFPTYSNGASDKKLERLENHLTSKEIFDTCYRSYEIRDEPSHARSTQELKIAQDNAVLCHIVMDTVRSGLNEASAMLQTTSGRNNSVDKTCYQKQASSYNQSPLWFLKESVDATPSGNVLAHEHIGRTVYLVVSNYIQRTCRLK